MSAERAPRVDQLTVVIPTYQRAGCVGRAVESALAQVPVAPRVIVVDDGSTDGTGAVLERFAGSIQVIVKDNGGVSSARNVGIAAVETPWVAFLDSDDALRPTALATACGLLETGVDACLLSACVLDGGEPTGDVLTKPGPGALYTLRGLFGPEESYAVPTGVFPVETTRAVGGFDERLRGAEDYLFLTRLVARGLRLGIVREPLFDKEEGAGERLSAHRVANIRHKLRALGLFRELEPEAAREVASALRDREARYLARLGRALPALGLDDGGVVPGSREPARLLFAAWSRRPVALDVLLQAVSAWAAPRRFHRRRAERRPR